MFVIVIHRITYSGHYSIYCKFNACMYAQLQYIYMHVLLKQYYSVRTCISRLIAAEYCSNCYNVAKTVMMHKVEYVYMFTGEKPHFNMSLAVRTVVLQRHAHANNFIMICKLSTAAAYRHTVKAQVHGS